ncbi:centromere protein X, partial [Kalaharituber pfeilii]
LPPHLISRILHSFLTDETTRISNAAVSSVSEYTRTFVREAIYRAVAEREKRQGKQGSGGIAGYVELEVEDLERVGPQLMLDF